MGTKRDVLVMNMKTKTVTHHEHPQAMAQQQWNIIFNVRTRNDDINDDDDYGAFK